MSILDIFKINSFKTEITRLNQENALLTSMLKPEHHEMIDINQRIERLKLEESDLLNKLNLLHSNFSRQSTEMTSHISLLQSQYESKKKDLFVLDEQIMLESFSLYEPKYDFINSEYYKRKLDDIRERQKDMIKAGIACTGNTNWTVNNNKAEGRKMVNDMIKLTLRSFNNECESCVSNVKFNNIHTHEKRINTSFEALNKLGRIMSVHISEEYKSLKLQELHLAYEYQLKKQEEKEGQKQIREQMREEAMLQREVEEARKTVEKEKRHYMNALEKALKQLEACKSDDEKVLLETKINELNGSLNEIEQQLKDIDYREANQRAGYVYVISNIGSFGEHVYKIGMTRRLDPYDRVYELGDASVPFNFDVHAMIFSNDAPKLEASLHREFESRRLNAINKRREYFRVSLDEIEKVIKRNHDQTIEFINTAAADEYRESQLLQNQQKVALNEVRQSINEAATSVQR